MLRIGLFLSLIFTAASCKQSDNVSEPSFDRATIQKLRTDLNLSDSELGELCGKNTLLVYVGNGEAIGKLQFFSHLDQSAKAVIQGEFNATSESFSKYVTQDVPAKLERAILANRGLCHANSAEGAMFTLAMILDGHGVNNSKVITHRFRYDGAAKNWRSDGKKYWKVVGVDFMASRADEAFELDMPTQTPIAIGGIIKNPEIGDDKFDQITYIYKTHGGLVSKANSHPDLLNSETGAQNSAHVFLFDPVGPNGADLTQNSGMFYYFWHKRNACEIAAKSGVEALRRIGCAGSPESYTANSGLGEGTNTADSGLGGNTANSGLGEGTNTADSGLGGNTANSGLGEGANTANSGLGGNTANSGLGGNTANSGLGGNTANSGLGGNTANSGLGGNTANVGLGGNTAGASKSAISRVDIRQNIGSIKEASRRPDAYLMIGRALSYDTSAFADNAVENAPVRLMSLTPGSDVTLPSVVYLDSCYGSSKVLNSFAFTFDHLRRSVQYYGNKLIPSYFNRPEAFYGYAFGNPNPFYIKGLDYDNAPIDFFKIWPAALLWADQPAVFKEFKKKHSGSQSNHEAIRATVASIKQHWSQNLSLFKVAKDEANKAGANTAIQENITNAELNAVMKSAGLDPLDQNKNTLQAGAYAAFVDVKNQ